MIFGWLTKDGEVESVSIGGDESYSAGSWYPNDVEVIVTYHTFPSDEAETKIEESTNNTASSQETILPENMESNETVFTVENCEDLALALIADGPSSPEIIEFAKGYQGKRIKFDGNIAYLMQHDNYTTRYDLLIYAGDYNEESVKGPNLKFEDVSISDLNLIGSKIPDTLGVGMNIRVTAEIVGYIENSELIILKPVSVEIR